MIYENCSLRDIGIANVGGKNTGLHGLWSNLAGLLLLYVIVHISHSFQLRLRRTFNCHSSPVLPYSLMLFRYLTTRITRQYIHWFNINILCPMAKDVKIVNKIVNFKGTMYYKQTQSSPKLSTVFKCFCAL